MDGQVEGQIDRGKARLTGSSSVILLLGPELASRLIRGSRERSE